MVLEDVFLKDAILINLESTEKDELFEEMIYFLHSAYPVFDANEALKSLNDREEKMSTGIMHNVAVPHAVVSSLKKGAIGAIGISKNGIDYDSLDKSPVKVVFMILAGEDETEKHIQILKSLALVLQKPDFLDKLCSCKTQTEAFNLLVQFEEAV